MRELWPKARIIGVEPLAEHWREMRKFDREPDVMIRGAVYHTEDEQLTFHLNYEPDQRATIYGLPIGVKNEITREIPTVTLDGIAKRYGPFPNAMLWMDIEGGEYEALRCASLLTDHGAIRWINVELNFCTPRNLPPWALVNSTLEGYDFRLLAMHSISRNGRQGDGIYIRKRAWTNTRLKVNKRSNQRKAERLAAGRGKTGEKYPEQEALPREESKSTAEDHAKRANSNRRHTGTAQEQAAPRQGPT